VAHGRDHRDEPCSRILHRGSAGGNPCVRSVLGVALAGVHGAVTRHSTLGAAVRALLRAQPCELRARFSLRRVRAGRGLGGDPRVHAQRGRLSGRVHPRRLRASRRGQITAGRAIGLSKVETIYYVVLPQGLRYAIPSWTNEFVYLIKYSSLAAFITVPELYYRADQIASETFRYTLIFVVTGLTYLALVLTASKLMRASRGWQFRGSAPRARSERRYLPKSVTTSTPRASYSPIAASRSEPPRAPAPRSPARRGPRRSPRRARTGRRSWSGHPARADERHLPASHPVGRQRHLTALRLRGQSHLHGSRGGERTGPSCGTSRRYRARPQKRPPRRR